MAFTLKSTYELNDFTFEIPSYQRGYRWDRDQVETLLNDLKEFLNSNPGPTDAYYLQPVIVKPIGNQKYEVIDGQQRLTTLYLILNCLQKHWSFATMQTYGLTFAKRPKQDAVFLNKGYNNPDYEKNIDTFYMQKAYEVIDDWMGSNFQVDMNLMTQLWNLLSAPAKGTERPSVKVIWYEIGDADVIETFKDLNYGRIPLTGTELVKAILLADYGDASVTSNRANEWDRMEKSLQDSSFWSMLKVNDTSISHIDFVLDLVAKELNDNLTTQLEPRRYGMMYNYNVVNAYIREQMRTGKKITGVVEEIWDMIADNFNRIRNWYDNPQWYNYIGLWSRIGTCTVTSIRVIEKSASSKEAMTEGLRKEIKRTLTTKVVDKRTKEEELEGKHILDADALNYDDNPDALRLILLAFNVMIFMERNAGSRFPFNLYDKFNETSLEHIHPQNITFDLKYFEVKKWVTERLENAQALKPEELIKAKTDAETLQAIEERLQAEFDKKIWESDKKVDAEGEDWRAVSDDVASIDRIFGDLAEISISELHKISNMALVNQAANAALSNKYLDAKRRRLFELADEGKMYLMPATELAFSKHFTATGSKQYLLGDMRFWRKEDRQEYLAALKTIFDQLTK